ADPAAPPDVEDLRSHARERVARFKVPAAVEFVAELPRNASGKVLRRELVGTAAAATRDDVEP
ncbi:MAG: long-chain fatty acid--CoA ligase, partial [Acidimicrobiia bacterium]